MANADDLLDQGEIESLLAPRRVAGENAPTRATVFADCETLLDRAAEELDALGAAKAERAVDDRPADEARPFEFPEFDCNPASEADGSSKQAADVEIEVKIELGRTFLSTDDAARLREGSVATLDALACDPVDVVANGQLIARGEVLVVKDCFCVRIAEIIAPAPTP